MAYKYEYINTVGSMSLRSVDNVDNTPIGSLPKNTKAFGDEVVTHANGDKWLKVISPFACYVAVIHNGTKYGVLTEIIPTDPQPNPTFPESFTLTDPSGNKAEYRFVRLLE